MSRDHIHFPCGCEFAYDSEDEKPELDPCPAHLSPSQIHVLRQRLALISGLAELIADDGIRVTAKAEQIIRHVSNISELMGWHTEAAEIREAVGKVKGESK